MKKIKLDSLTKYTLYEESVQSAERDIPWMIETYIQNRQKRPSLLREDFCGTHKLSAEWVKFDSRNHAYGLDLDSEPLNVGKKLRKKELTPSQQKRIHLFKKNVCSVSTKKVDLVIAFNFSYFIFKQRNKLLDYFKAAQKSLKKDGIFFLEFAGGPGMLEKTKEKTTHYNDAGKPWFTYIWDQKYYNPINSEGKYSIHFKFAQGKQFSDVFEYDWRIWGLSEIQDVLKDAGFKEVKVYWEAVDKKTKAIFHTEMKDAPNEWAYIIYIAGLK
jgi:hypothetical protein